VVKESLTADHKSVPQPDSRGDDLSDTAQAAAEVLKLALKIVSEREGIAPKLIASSADIEALAANDDAPVPLMAGWRRRLFGNVALDLKSGRAVIGFRKGRAQILRGSDIPELEAAE
jgi:ribonuclease D